MAAYYNEIDPKAAAWLRELIKAGLIADGEVDDRSIELVRPSDLGGFTQCHFFAGIGGWSYALRLAGWSDYREAWTGSCPCQPFSAAGKGAGADDSRDLWPTWFELIKECRPPVVFGEQVASADGLGWIDRVSADVEAQDYALAAVDLCAPSVGAFHIRQRLWFVADTGLSDRRISESARSDASEGSSVHHLGCGDVGELADTTGRNAINGAIQRSGQYGLRAQDRCIDGRQADGQRAKSSLDDAERERAGRSASGEGRPQCSPQGAGEDKGRRVIQTLDPSATCNVGHAKGKGLERERGQQSASIVDERGRFTGLPGVSWADADWLPCIDGKARPVEPGTFPLAHGIPARVGRLRGYGNAIVPQVAAEFINAYLSVIGTEDQYR